MRFIHHRSLANPDAPWSEGFSVTSSVADADDLATLDFVAPEKKGELARFLLALKVQLAARADGLTMIFDEIDRGVGGATADAVGRRLQKLAAAGQVLVVTHSPQVAALGACHYLISKSTSGKVARTEVRALDASGRKDEIARMLAGDRVTDAARDAARALLADAER